jgi:hypothetical protein
MGALIEEQLMSDTPKMIYASGADRWLEETFRPFVRTWIESIRNLLVVVAFNYLASKTNNNSLHLLAFLTMMLFSVHLMLYVQLAFPVWYSTSKKKWIRYPIELVGVALALYTVWTWSTIITRAIDDLSKLQGK